DFKNNKDGVVLLTNGRGGMSRFQVDLGRTDSKYDALLAVNANERWPVDREVLCKNIRAWLVTDGFSQPLDKSSLKEIALGSAAALSFKAGACNGVAVNISMEAMMVPNRNCTVLKFNRNEIEIPEGKSFSEITHIDLIIRVDLENRNFHETSKHNSAIAKKIIVNSDKRGFTFNRSDKNQLHVFCREGEFYLEPDYRRDIPHVFDSERGQTPTGNSFSPGWFKIDLQQASEFTLVMDADAYSFGNNQPLTESDGDKVGEILKDSADKIVAQSGLKDEFGKALAIALDGFVVKRDSEKTVIAGYPWFLDWGRDTLIAARGMLAGGRHKEVAEILKLFGKYVQNGTMPNSIHGHDHSNRDTSDAPLWYGIVVEDIVELEGDDFYNLDTGDGRTISKVLEDIGNGYKNGTSNGIYMDKESSLVWSPSHFTWMDTNHPAGTPREGYPIEIQVMWIRLLRHLTKLEKAGMIEPSNWETLANSAHESLVTMFYDAESGSMADLIKATSGTPAKDGALDTALRSNAIMAVSLGVIKGDKAKSTVMAAISHLVIPGAIRSLAPLTVKVPLGIYSKNGVLLNDPVNPYWGEYKGDEDTKRKPAYHNGTAWTWPFPMLCEAIVMAWPNDKNAQKAARSYLLSMDYFIKEGCIGQIPEIIDGDFPHRQRGCDAQAWGVSEALRVWKKLN
ncbi:MAG: glycogen debranching enzyme N-terminal domain-containing protein, partial [Deltaproteobacteria bacterium]|nr:glycogen debranching enzyme N-terminal domain-containing protein [Deltaproteobacteria bacterium]